MTKIMRIDKILSNMGYGSRKEIKSYIKSGDIEVNGKIISKASTKVDALSEIIKFRGKRVIYKEFIYIMLNKPKKYISATEDDDHKTVIDLLDPRYLVYSPYPIGRLDIDTTGLLILTNDGDLTHNIISPKKGIIKKYIADIKGRVTQKEVKIFREGIYLKKEDYKTLPAELVILQRGEISKVSVSISEGKYHQVKRMFEAVGMKVIELKRISIGDLNLDDSLKEGEYRELTEDELDKLKEVF